MDIKTLNFIEDENKAKLVRCLEKDKDILRRIPHQPGEFSEAEPFHGQICNPEKYGDYYNYYKDSYQLPSFEKNIITPFSHLKIKKYTNKIISKPSKPKLSIWPQFFIHHNNNIGYDADSCLCMILKGGQAWGEFMLDIYPYIYFCKELLDNNPNIKIITKTPNFDSHDFLIKYLDINNDIIYLKDLESLKIKNLYIIETIGPYASGLFPYQAYGNIPVCLYRNTYNYLQNKLNFKSDKKIMIYTMRNTGNNRRSVKNESEIINLLEKYCQNNQYLFVPFFYNNYTVEERIKLFNCANIVIGVHGSANFHAYFCKPNTRVIELICVKDCHSIQLPALSFGLDYWQIPIKNYGQFEKTITLSKDCLESLKKILNK